MNSKTLRDFNILIQQRSFVTVVLTLLFLATPGIAIIYTFNPELFLKLDWVKLILLAISITTPFCLLNALFLRDAFGEETELDENHLFWDFSVATSLSGVLLYSMLIFHYFLEFSFRRILIALLMIESALLVIAWFRQRRTK